MYVLFKAKSVIACSDNGQWNASFAVCDMSDTECPRIETAKSDMNITCNGYNTGRYTLDRI